MSTRQNEGQRILDSGNNKLGGMKMFVKSINFAMIICFLIFSGCEVKKAQINESCKTTLDCEAGLFCVEGVCYIPGLSENMPETTEAQMKIEDELLPLAKNGDLYIYSPSGTMIPIDEKGNIAVNFHREPITQYYLVQKDLNSVRKAGTFQLINFSDNIDSIAGIDIFELAEKSAEDKDFSLKFIAADDVSFFFNNVINKFDESISRVVEGATKSYADFVGNKIDNITDQFDQIKEIVEGELSRITPATLALGYVANQSPLAWTQQKPGGVYMLKYLSPNPGASDEAFYIARELVRIQTMTLTAEYIASKIEFWQLVDLIGQKELTGQPTHNWDKDEEIRSSALALAQKVMNDIKYNAFDVDIPHSSCFGTPEWKFRSGELEIEFENYCANLMYVSTTGKNSSVTGMLKEEPKPTYRIKPDLSIFAALGIVVDLFSGNEINDDNGLRNMVSSIPTIVSEGRMAGLWGKKTSWTVDESVLKDLRGKGDNILINWTNGFVNSNFPQNTTVRVMPGTYNLFPYSLLVPGIGLSAGSLFVLATAYEFVGESPYSVSHDGAFKINNNEARELLKNLAKNIKDDPAARRAFVANSLLLAGDTFALLADTAQLVASAATAGTAGGTAQLLFATSIIKSFVNAFVTSDVNMAALVDHIDSIAPEYGGIEPLMVLITSEFLIQGCVLQMGVNANMVCSPLADYINPVVEEIVPKEIRDKHWKLKKTSTGELINVSGITEMIVLEILSDFSKKTSKENKDYYDYITAIEIMGNAVMSAIEMTGEEGAKSIIGVLDILTIFSNAQTVVSSGFTFFYNQSYGSVDFGSAFCDKNKGGGNE